MSIAAINQPEEIIVMNIVHKATGEFIATLDDIRNGKVKDLECANLADAYLSCANLADAYLSCADLADAYLSCADLSGANLSCADLSGANLRGANLEGADLSGVDLWGVIGDGHVIKSIIGLLYDINYTKDVIQIGCENNTHLEWAEFSDEEIAAMDDGALEFWTANKEMILNTVKSNFNKG